MLLQEKTPTPSAPSRRRVMGVCTGPKLLKTKRTIQKETRDHFFFLFVSSSISHSKSVAQLLTCWWPAVSGGWVRPKAGQSGDLAARCRGRLRRIADRPRGALDLAALSNLPIEAIA